MTTIYTVLPIYDSVLKQDYNRTGCIIPIYTPRHRLPSWQYKTTETPGAVTRIDLVNSSGTLTNITTYFPTLSDDYVLTASTYYKYDGDTLNYLLPYGAYYLKITHANGYYYYSEWFVVADVYPKVATSFTNNTYETFSASGTAITCVETGIQGDARSNVITVRKGEILRVIFYLTLNSGQAPFVEIYSPSLGVISSQEQSSAGLYIVNLTATSYATDAVIDVYNTLASNYVTSEIYIIRSYSANYIKIAFNDTHDLGDIVYQDGFTQELYLNNQLNTPQHEPVMVGDEKDGIFIAEKIVTKFKFRIVTYVGPVLYRSLIRLPQHDTITITDEVGFTYSPQAGNLQVNPINWNQFDYGTLEIIFNDNSEFIWTSEANNLT